MSESPHQPHLSQRIKKARKGEKRKGEEEWEDSRGKGEATEDGGKRMVASCMPNFTPSVQCDDSVAHETSMSSENLNY